MLIAAKSKNFAPNIKADVLGIFLGLDEHERSVGYVHHVKSTDCLPGFPFLEQFSIGRRYLSTIAFLVYRRFPVT